MPKVMVLWLMKDLSLQAAQVCNAQINLAVLAVNARKVFRLMLPIRKNVPPVQILNGGNSGKRKRTAVVQNPNYQEIQFFSH